MGGGGEVQECDDVLVKREDGRRFGAVRLELGDDLEDKFDAVALRNAFNFALLAEKWGECDATLVL